MFNETGRSARAVINSNHFSSHTTISRWIYNVLQIRTVRITNLKPNELHKSLTEVPTVNTLYLQKLSKCDSISSLWLNLAVDNYLLLTSGRFNRVCRIKIFKNMVHRTTYVYLSKTFGRNFFKEHQLVLTFLANLRAVGTNVQWDFLHKNVLTY